MIVTHEHYGYTLEKSSLDLSDHQKSLLQKKNIIKKFTRSDNNHETCFNLIYDDDQELYRLTTSYIIGVNWILEGKLPIYIKPKLNNDSLEIDHLSMFFDIVLPIV